MTIFKQGFSKKISNLSLNVASCVISYTLITFISFARYVLGLSYLYNANSFVFNSFMGIVLGIVLGIISMYVVGTNTFRKFMLNISHNTLNDDIFCDVLDLNNGSNLRIYFTNKDYYLIGHYKYHDDKDHTWLVLGAYIKMSLNGKELLNCENDLENQIMVKFEDIDTIELL